MTKLYVANATKQTFIFSYRLPEAKQTIQRTIPMGTQLFFGDFSSEEIKSIVDQGKPFGMIRVDEANQARDYKGLIYSENYEVKQGKIEFMLRANDDMLDRQGQELRKEAAMANVMGMNTQANNQNQTLNKVSMTVQQENEQPGSKQVSEGFRMEVPPAMQRVASRR